MTNIMESKFNSIIKKFGHNIYLQRRLVNSNGDNIYSDSMEIHTTIYNIHTSKNLPNTRQEQMEGIVSTSERVFYFKSKVNPFEGDRIYEEEFSPLADKSIWMIDQAVPMRGSHGAVIYWSVGATRVHPN